MAASTRLAASLEAEHHYEKPEGGDSDAEEEVAHGSNRFRANGRKASVQLKAADAARREGEPPTAQTPAAHDKRRTPASR